MKVFSRSLSLFNNKNQIKKMSTAFYKREMKAWQTEGFDGIEGLQLSSTIIPPILKPSEVLVKVSAASVNPLDVAVLGGYGQNVFNVLRGFDKFTIGNCDLCSPEFPITVGRDFVGEVVTTGASVKGVQNGDCVWGVVLPQRKGSHAQYVITEDFNLCLKPSVLTDIEAASLPYVSLTAWSAAVTTGSLKPQNCTGVRVVVLGASGGVGTVLTQLLSAWGAQVTGVCSEDAFEMVLGCGACDVIDYHDLDSMKQLKSQRNFDLVIDAAGSNDLGWSGALREWQGAAFVSLSSPVLRNTDEDGLLLGSLKSAVNLVEQNLSTAASGRLCKWAYFMPNESALKALASLVQEKKVRPMINKVFGFEEAREAYEHMKNGPNRGKTVIDFSTPLVEHRSPEVH